MELDIKSVNYDLRVEEGLWKFSLANDCPAPYIAGQGPKPAGAHDIGLIWIGTAIGSKALTREEAVNIVRSIVSSSRLEAKAMTVAEFVENKFVPLYLAGKSTSTRVNYRSILKLIVDPERVDQAFGNDAAREGRGGRWVPGWPYLGDISLNDVRPDSVQKLIAAAFNGGYSPQRVSQLRYAIVRIFSFAAEERDFVGHNPVLRINWPDLRRKGGIQDLAQAWL
jgi:hypothetical protein